MSELLWPSPDVIELRRRRRLVVAFLVLAVVTLVGAMALVSGFDVVSQNAFLAQLATQGSLLYPVACTACDSGFSLPLSDWRALTIWGLAMVAGVAGWTVRRSL